VKCTSLFYDGTKQDPQDFINRWRAALEEASRFCGPFPSRHIYYQLLIAIGYTKETHQWLELLEQDPLATCESILEQTYADFVTSEHSRLFPWQYQSVHMSALDTNSASSPSKRGHESQYCEFHKRRAIHSTDDCYLNPTNAGEKGDGASTDNEGPPFTKPKLDTTQETLYDPVTRFFDVA
jgi:hypothetical protein